MAHGAAWIFIVDGVSAAEAASEYVMAEGVDFGWHTHDGDNSLGDCFVKYSGVYDSTPWIGVIRPSDMQLMHDEPDGSFLDIATIAEEMDPD